MVDQSSQSEKSIFCAALEMDEEDRSSFIASACRGNDELEQRLLRLLAAHSDKASTADAMLDRDARNRDPDHIGPYSLIQRIGEGGMGVVYIAEQKSPVRRRVALKLIKAGMDTREVIARFHSERQAMALMNHPHIARILDAGATDSGRPYFVMEYVPGMPLLEYCDRLKMRIEQRVRLFIAVCLAVQHAHQKGIIHRDIKPSNILVMEEDGRPMPKVIDFGVAKATSRELSDLTLHTWVGAFVGTPDYVSPEQADLTALDVDTRADVYSLGAVLYELLAGVRPFDLQGLSYSEIVARIRQHEPKPPSEQLRKTRDADIPSTRGIGSIDILRRRIRGDLDWITMKAMRKDRARRFSSASELAADLTRYLENQPVLAGPPSVAYRVRKLARRHSVLLGFAGFGTLALLFALFGTLFGLARAKDEAAVARTQATIAREVNGFLNNDLLSSVAPDQMGIAVSVREVLDRAAIGIDGRFEDQPLVEASLRSTIGRTYLRLGQHAAAEPHLERAHTLETEYLGSDHIDTLSTVTALGEMRRLEGRYGEAEGLLRHALTTLRSSIGNETQEAIEALRQLSILYERMGRLQESETLYLDCYNTSAKLFGPNHQRTLQVAQGLSILYHHMRRLDDAEKLQLEIWNRRRDTIGDEHPDTLNSVINLCALYLRQQRYSDAEPLLVESIEALKRVMGDEHPRTLIAMNNLGYLYEMTEEYEQAEKTINAVVDVKRRVLGRANPSTLHSMDNVVRIHKATGDTDALLQATSELLELRKERALQRGASPEDLNEYARLLTHAEPERLRDADTAVRIATEANAVTDYSNPLYLQTLSQAYAAAGNLERAISVCQQALAKTPDDGTSVRASLETELAQYETALATQAGETMLDADH